MLSYNKHVEKPWGYEKWWAITDKYVGKILYIKNNHRLSLQYHNIKMESMLILEGKCRMTVGDKTIIMDIGDSINIIPKTIHRMEAIDGDLKNIEVSTPELEDVVRIQDDYSRI